MPRIAAAGGALALMVPGLALAQTPSPLAEWQYSAGIPLQRLFVPQLPVWQTELGLGAQYAPQYDGAPRYQILPGPSFNLRYRGLFFASTGEGVGVNLATGEHYRVGVAISYDLGRRDASDYSQLHGLGNINPAPEAKAFAEYTLSRGVPLVVRVDVRRAIGGTNGVIGDVGAYVPLPGSSRQFVWFAGPTLTLADATYMNRTFGIGEAQAARSGDARYKASAGLKSAGFGVSANWFVTSHWILNTSAAFMQLLDSAANSPITRAASEGVVSLSVAYRF
jgi:outer membrane scaffolding protein for murein synthesis (MipA/OmpV family)